MGGGVSLGDGEAGVARGGGGRGLEVFWEIIKKLYSFHGYFLIIEIIKIYIYTFKKYIIKKFHDNQKRKLTEIKIIKPFGQFDNFTIISPHNNYFYGNLKTISMKNSPTHSSPSFHGKFKPNRFSHLIRRRSRAIPTDSTIISTKTYLSSPRKHTFFIQKN